MSLLIRCENCSRSSMPGQCLRHQQSHSQRVRKNPRLAFDNAGGAELAQRRHAAHHQVGENRLVAADRQDGIAQGDAALGQHAHDHGLRQGDDQDPGGVGFAGMVGAAPFREALQDQRQQHRIVIAFGEDRKLRAAVDRTDEIRHRVGEAVKPQQVAHWPEDGPRHTLGFDRYAGQGGHQNEQ
jgi:hypothetical protein